MTPNHCTKVIPKRGTTTDKWLFGKWWTWLLHLHLTAEKHWIVFFLYFHPKKNQLLLLLLPSRKVHGELPISKDFIRYRANLWFQPPLCFPLSPGRERELKNYFISHSPHAAVSILPALYLSELLYWQKENTNIFGEEKLQEGCWWSSGCPGVCAGTFGEKIGDV